MNIFYSHLSDVLPSSFLLFKIPPPTLDMPSFASYSEKTAIHIGAILFLIVSGILFRCFERIRSSRIQQQLAEQRSYIIMKFTHGLRTSLTIILGLSKQLQEQKDLSCNNLSTYLNVIERQGRHLSELINQLSDIDNLYMGDKTMEWKTGNIVAFAEMVSETFRLCAEQKEIDLYFLSDEKKIEADFVPDFFNKILHHLLSNAIKYSGEGGRIYLIVERNKKDRKKIIIKVIDHGKGINKEMLPHISKLFYKCPYAGTEIPAGHGVGLTLTKRLTEILGGTIRVESEEGKGSTFTVELPVYSSKKQLLPHWEPEKNTTRSLVKLSEKVEYVDFFSSEINENDPRTIILLAEDNKDIALYIRSIFHQEQYNIIYASNGEKAWNIMNHKQLPDIVIADMIMPKKCGIELCKGIKASSLLNHIPVIIISAKNREADLIESLKSGADSYVRKPFHPEELQAHVQNLLRNRQLLREKYHRTMLLKEEKEKSDDNVHANFLRLVTDIIYREIKNPDFTPAKLAQELAISASQLNKKLNAAIGCPASIYILQVKLFHAKKILSTQDKTIGEVATECGIYDVNYFSRAFKKHNGVTPTQFKRLPPKTLPANSFAD